MKGFAKLLFAFTGLFFCFSQLAYATHYRAGEITYKLIAPFKYEVIIHTYSKYDGESVQADKNEVVIFWGDNSADTVVRSNGFDGDGDGYKDGEIIATDPISIKYSQYKIEHTYSGAPPPPNRYYLIYMVDVNRIGGILNFGPGNTQDVAFYVEDTLKYPTDLANIGFNSSPILTNPPIDYANLRDTFVHNPGAVDKDEDSLDYRLVPCKFDFDKEIPLYSYPDQYCKSTGADPGNTFTINRRTGQIVWATPCRVGIFNIAILITEYRNGVSIGTMLRDMQIIVLNEQNDPPQVFIPADTCIRAGDSLSAVITATDRNQGQNITLSAIGGPFNVSPIAKFSPITPQSSPAQGTFEWRTDCNLISGQPYFTVFRAADDYKQPGNPPMLTPLVDLETWQIRVIAPPPLNLTAMATPQSVLVSWDTYNCASSPDFRGFSVWRKSGCDLFTPDYCETGLGGRGYTKLTGANIFTYNYTDNTTVVGQQYTYRVVAHFSKLSPNGLFQFNANESVASNGYCIFMPVSAPAILNVDVQQTDVTNGQIFVRWAKPLAGGLNLDTLQNPPPYRFDLYRGTGFNLTNPVLIRSTVDAPSFSAIADTTFTDPALNTQDSAWSYKVLFYANNDTAGVSAPASSVYLNVSPSDQSLVLNWSEKVPWNNDSFEVFRLNKLTSVFAPIDTVYNHSYIDTGLINDSTYCYFVRAYGHYDLTYFPRPLINNSQQDCAIPIDTTPPCPPMLSVRNDCDQYNGVAWTAADYINYLTWTNQNDPCSADINRYYIYFGADSAGMVVIDSILSRDDTTYNHKLIESLAGCYAITAADRLGNESAYSNVFCIDNCPYYVLPNAFTPNGDGANEKFTPFKPYRFVPKIEMKIFNRWGEQVFSTEDPEINWDGRDQKGREVSEGVYEYGGYYYEQHQSGLVKKPLSGQKKGGGFIHLIRGK